MSPDTSAVDFVVDLTNCDREPIQFLGSIQPIGFLLCVSTDWLIQRVSANIADYAGQSVDALLGEPVEALLPQGTIHMLRGRLQLLASPDTPERIFNVDIFEDDRRFDVSLHISGQSIVIEVEPRAAETGNPGALIKTMITRVQKAETLANLHRECVRQLRAVTGFDRVMLYRFSADNSGHVVAEAARTGIGSFLDLHYPASDIPAQARTLYLRNPIRVIADIDAPGVPVLPLLDPSGKPLDLSLAGLRSVSPIHLEYLRNMCVGASMSVSVIIDGKLWGLFALHHYQPRVLGMELRAAVELFAQMVSLTIEGRLNKERRLAEEAARELHDRFISKIVASMPSADAMADFGEELRGIIACDGFVVWAKGEAKASGRCPGTDEIRQLARFLNRAGASRIYAADNLSAVHPPAEAYVDEAAGVLAIPISRAPRDYMLFFRQEIVQTVTWAGDPATKEKQIGPHGARLTPRKSFDAWKETVYGRSEPWSERDLKAAEALRVSILEILLRFNEETERQQGLATQRQELLIAELNHRVRNILSLIRAIVAQSKPGAKSVEDFARIISGRVQALARAHDQITTDSFQPVSLGSIVHTEVSAYIGNKASRVDVSGPRLVVEASAFSTLALVFHELVTNSAKYGALSDSRGSVAVSTMVDDHGSCHIVWRESGGPAVQAPTRRGFGSTIIERSIPHDLGGEAKLDYRLGGLVAEFILPPNTFRHEPDGATIQQTGRAGEAANTMTDAPALSLDGLSGLIVEDNMIISLDAEQLMLDNGMRTVFTAASVADAERIIEEETIDVALLDVNLGPETSFPLVKPLNARGVPYVFVTGYGEKVELPAEAAGTTAIKKPFASDELIAALRNVLKDRS